MGTSTNRTPRQKAYFPSSKDSGSTPEKDNSEKTTKDASHGVFKNTRTNANNFIRNNDKAYFEKSISLYIDETLGGYKDAAKIMQSECSAINKIYDILNSALGSNIREVISEPTSLYSLEILLQYDAQQITSILIDIIYPSNANLDDSITRASVIEAIGDLDLNYDEISSDDIKMVMKKIISRTIQNRITQDILADRINLPEDIESVKNIEFELKKFIDELIMDELVLPENILSPKDIENLYTAAFKIISDSANKED